MVEKKTKSLKQQAIEVLRQELGEKEVKILDYILSEEIVGKKDEVSVIDELQKKIDALQEEKAQVEEEYKKTFNNAPEQVSENKNEVVEDFKSLDDILGAFTTYNE